MAEEKEVIEEMVQVEEGDKCHHPDLKDRQFVLLLRVTQANGRPLPTEGFTSRAMTQMIHDITGVIRYSNRPRGSFRNRAPILYNRSVQSDTRVVSLGRSINHSRLIGLNNPDYKRVGDSERKAKRMPTTNDWDLGEGKWTSQKGWKHL